MVGDCACEGTRWENGRMGEGEVWKREGVDVWGGPAARTEEGVRM